MPLRPKLGPRFHQAFLFAAEKHATQTRKKTGVPYISHLMSVAALVLEAGGDEDQAIAALLHDVVEDCGGEPMLSEVRQRFGDRVARIVEGCTDAYSIPKPPWKQRKLDYLDILRRADDDIRLVSAADKLHNVRPSSPTTVSTASPSSSASPDAAMAHCGTTAPSSTSSAIVPTASSQNSNA